MKVIFYLFIPDCWKFIIKKNKRFISGKVQRKELGLQMIVACSLALKLLWVLSSDLYSLSFTSLTRLKYSSYHNVGESPLLFLHNSIPMRRNINDIETRETYYQTFSFLSFPGASLNDDPEREGGRGAAKNRQWEKRIEEMRRTGTKSILGWKWEEAGELSFSRLSFSL